MKKFPSSQQDSVSVSEAVSEPESTESEQSANNTLIVYFSRWGNTEYPSDEDATTSASIVVDGDITYCEAHHNMAIFYAQSDNPNLSVDVIPIGRVTSDLSVFDDLDSREEITFSLAE